jgi:DNA-binding MarR family transcriptional regulator
MSGLLKALEIINALRVIHPEMPMQMASVFIVIAMQPGIYQRDLPEIIGISQSSVSRNVTALTKMTRHGTQGLGLVVRRHDPEDGRGYELYLSKAGRLLEERLVALSR